MGDLRSARWHGQETGHNRRARSLPNGDLDVRDEDVVSKPRFNFRGIGALEKQLQRFLEVVSCFLDGFALTCNVELRTVRNESCTFRSDDRRQSSAHRRKLRNAMHFAILEIAMKRYVVS